MRLGYARPLAIVAGLLVLAVLAVAAFPVGLLRATAERRLSSHFGAPVTLGALSRREAISFTPEIVVKDVRIGQPRLISTDRSRIAGQWIIATRPFSAHCLSIGKP
ncbi:hypothetical protein [Sphingomonas colocasiae]|uniref:Uncharacterized protein n=1 Tax=Sphingomonas colocasiae TaxID=1848973 RepID=A0ABS7Q1N2_9SPHN|nr:hypothetical protein [Sphingomonas colocasiae]MBY8823307.1 hypothetical protein [Sphingomonas colocasiae]MBY8826442.1 hypothetical protein [Sphingomonas colocasiae]